MHEHMFFWLTWASSMSVGYCVVKTRILPSSMFHMSYLDRTAILYCTYNTLRVMCRWLHECLLCSLLSQPEPCGSSWSVSVFSIFSFNGKNPWVLESECRFQQESLFLWCIFDGLFILDIPNDFWSECCHVKSATVYLCLCSVSLG